VAATRQARLSIRFATLGLVLVVVVLMGFAAVAALVQLVESGFGEPSTSLGPGDTWNA